MSDVARRNEISYILTLLKHNSSFVEINSQIMLLAEVRLIAPKTAMSSHKSSMNTIYWMILLLVEKPLTKSLSSQRINNASLRI